MLKKIYFLSLCLLLSLSPLAQAAHTQNQNDVLEQLSSHDLKTLTEAATDVVNNLSDEEKAVLVKSLLEKKDEIDALICLTENGFYLVGGIAITIIVTAYVCVLHQLTKHKKQT